LSTFLLAIIALCGWLVRTITGNVSWLFTETACPVLDTLLSAIGFCMSGSPSVIVVRSYQCGNLPFLLAVEAHVRWLAGTVAGEVAFIMAAVQAVSSYNG